MSTQNSPSKNVVKTYHILGISDKAEVPVNEVVAALIPCNRPDE